MTIRVEQDRWGPGSSILDDAFDVWRFDRLCHSDNVLTSGKRPDTDGAVPAGGPY